MLQTTGLQLYDRSGRGNRGTLTNMDAASDWVTSKVRITAGWVLYFDGTNDTVIVPDRPSISITGTGLTLSAWVRQTGATAYKQIFAKASGTGSTNRSYGLYITGASGPGAANSLGFETRTSSTVENGFGAIASNVWTHCVGTYSGSVMTWYLQGAQVGQVAQTGSIAAQNSALYLGQFSSGGFSTFSGQIAEWAIWHRAVTASETRTLYRLGPGWFGKRESLVIGYSEQFAAGFKAYWARRQSQLIGGGV
jgi:hypothetical protein